MLRPRITLRSFKRRQRRCRNSEAPVVESCKHIRRIGSAQRHAGGCIQWLRGYECCNLVTISNVHLLYSPDALLLC